jgi:hypothetical protein
MTKAAEEAGWCWISQTRNLQLASRVKWTKRDIAFEKQAWFSDSPGTQRMMKSAMSWLVSSQRTGKHRCRGLKAATGADFDNATR